MFKSAGTIRLEDRQAFDFGQPRNETRCAAVGWWQSALICQSSTKCWAGRGHLSDAAVSLYLATSDLVPVAGTIDRRMFQRECRASIITDTNFQ